jgi:hypothetical protein
VKRPVSAAWLGHLAGRVRRRFRALLRAEATWLRRHLLGVPPWGTKVTPDPLLEAFRAGTPPEGRGAASERTQPESGIGPADGAFVRSFGGSRGASGPPPTAIRREEG